MPSAQDRDKELLTDIWYLAMAGHQLKKGQLIGKVILNRNMVFGRDDEGNIFCLRDLCPHRGVPLSYGNFDGKEIECCYHGWIFNGQGVCTKIPALGDSAYDTEKIKVFKFPVKEINGNIWVYIPATYRMNYEVMEDAIADFPVSPEKKFMYVSTHELACDLDNAVIGLIDPAHVPNVHASWWWRSKKKQKRKQKKFIPSKMGFVMAAHQPASNSKVYNLFKKNLEIEITFSIPGVRVEHIRYGKKGEIVLLTTLSPLTDHTTELNQFFYTNIPLVRLLFPIIRPIGKVFINQDVAVVNKQKEGLKYDPPLMLVGEADQQARWYYKLKDNFRKAVREKEPLEHPLKENTVLTWYT